MATARSWRITRWLSAGISSCATAATSIRRSRALQPSPLSWPTRCGRFKDLLDRFDAYQAAVHPPQHPKQYKSRTTPKTYKPTPKDHSGGRTGRIDFKLRQCQAVLLKYRTPTRDEKEMFTLPVQDAQRAMGLVRHHATEWGLDPKRAGLLGFSAGGNLTGHAAWDRGERTYLQKPDLDDARGPDFIVFVYGGGFLDAADKTKFRPGFSVPSDAPPAFFLVAHDDKTNPVEATMLSLEYKKRGIPAELHICTKGGHGFGMRRDKHPVNDWPQRCGEWMRSMGYLDAR